MLFLLFRAGGEWYALDAGLVAQVLPLVNIRPIPHSAPGVAGVITYRAAPVPVIDLSELMLGRPATARLSTRIVLVHYPAEDGATKLLGLIVEGATETLRRDPAEFVAHGVASAAALYLGAMATDVRGLIQRVEVSQLLPATLRETLFCKDAAL